MKLSPRAEPTRYDAIVIGSGFGGALCALPLVHAGCRVLMLERGPWVRRGPANRAIGGERAAYHSSRHRLRGDRRGRTGSFECVGGASVFYGGASVRFRPEDFQPDPCIVATEPARWPVQYADLAASYTAVERLLGVTGDERHDPTAPPRRVPLPLPPRPMGPAARLLSAAAGALGLRPFRLPMALARDDRCAACGRCDGFACAVGAKADLATAVLPGLVASGLDVRCATAAVRLLATNDRVVAVEVVDVGTGARRAIGCDVVILAAGALVSPALLLHSGLADRNPACAYVGRGLMRHANAVVAGYFGEALESPGHLQKEIAVHDFYHGARHAPPGRLGSIQQIDAGSAALARVAATRHARRSAEDLSRHLCGLIVIAEDQPHPANRVTVSARGTDRLGGPRITVRHRHTPRDLDARAALAQRARQILLEAGARATATVPVEGFAHALGGLRMGDDPRTAPLDRHGRFRGIANLYVTDGSVFPTSGGINPSLTIAANALRVGAGIVGRSRADLQEPTRAVESAARDARTRLRLRV
jgi:choline dehydrogenase-like flavoprotein